MDAVRRAGYLGSNILGKKGFDHEIVVQVGAGAYICGDETGLLESLEGKKGQPRKKPPFPAQYGAFGLPSTVNNVETFAHVGFVLDRGAEWFRSIGTDKSPAPRSSECRATSSGRASTSSRWGRPCVS